MKLSHIIIKVDNLQNAVKEWTEKGFTVEYGKSKNPYNALIYFKDGPYIELFERCGLPKFLKLLMKIFGKKAFIDRMNYWDNHKPGLIGIEIETYENNLNKEISILNKYNEKFFKIDSTRIDTKNRELKFTCLFPDNMNIPPFMTYFSVDPKPKEDIHINKIKGVKSISFGTDEHLIPLINELCDDPRLKLFVGNGVRDLEWLK